MEGKKITPAEMEANKQEFIGLLSSVNRPGIPELIKWLESSDFFTAPSSTTYHGACDGGLCFHSLNVYRAFKMLYEQSKNHALPGKIKDIKEETIIIVTLLHDLCKTNFYVKETKVYKNDQTGEWIHYYGYRCNDNLPLGHGEKSMYIAQNFIHLEPSEAIAIRWHMGMFDAAVQLSQYEKPSFLAAANHMILVNLICMADYYASFMMEEYIDPRLDNII